ncbi:TetR/AcrR family transcriptional regulator [Kitasatospora sp. NPDC057223]|uniref:TetR/AcrR family transcriptional regulator n=1 Tax=Kitasatospora sp. NPDC057223 TaxID=3346055 RepID=UPI00363D1670
MGHREDLLVGAKLCLLEKGYARTTARDIVAASGANLASIGYHFGSKDSLLNAALMEATEEWSGELERALAVGIDPAADRVERFTIVWDRIIELIRRHQGLWAAQFEMFGEIQRTPDMRPFVSQSQEHARRGLAALLQQVDPSLDDAAARLTATFYLVLMTGLIAQLLTDPENAPSSSELAEAVRLVAAPAVSAPGAGTA